MPRCRFRSSLLTDFIGACAASLTMAVVTIPEPEHSHQEAPHLIREMKEGLASA
ncbi:MAG: hypothetical protein ACLTBV_28105 [Enterocloster bolteae]